MGMDDKLAASLPEPPLPAPARRQAAIEEALRRFDGGAPRPARAEAGRAPAAATPWWRRPTPSWAPAFATAVLALLIALPVAWTVIGDGSGERAGPDGAPAIVGKPSASGPPAAAAEPDSADETSGGSAALADTPAEAARRAPESSETGDIALAEVAAEPEPPPPAPPPARSDSKAARETRADEQFAATSTNVVVTGSRIPRPNLESTSPMASVSEEDS